MQGFQILTVRGLGFYLAAISACAILSVPSDAGGSVADDRLVVVDADADAFRHPEFVIDERGTYFAASEAQTGSGREVRVHRSTDHGETWHAWDTLTNPDPDTEFYHPSLTIADGSPDRLLLAYAYEFPSADNLIGALIVRRYDPTSEPGSGADVVVDIGTTTRFGNPALETDSGVHSTYYVYLAYEETTGGTVDTEIMFTRSTSQGAGFETPYVLMALGSNHWVRDPDISFGASGIVHVVADRHLTLDTGGLSYRRASARAVSSANWDAEVWIVSPTTDSSVLGPQIVARQNNSEVFLHYNQNDPGSFTPYFRASQNYGISWTPVSSSPSIDGYYGSIELDNNGGLGIATQALILNYPVTSNPFGPWAHESEMSGSYPPGNEPGLDSDPERGDLWGAVASVNGMLAFHGSWRDEQGYPTYQASIPLDPSDPVVTPAALIDLDGNDSLELVHVTDDGWISAIRFAGSVLPGWPRDIGDAVWGSPVAAGDIDLDGVIEIAVGDMDGDLHVFEPDGSYEAGFPRSLGSDPVHVSMDVITGQSPLNLVVGCGRRIWVLDPQGNAVDGYPVTLGADVEHPAALGDYDQDGENEVVVAYGQFLAVLDGRGQTEVFRNLFNHISDAPTMGDFDSNYSGLELMVPLINGRMHVLNGSGLDLPGSPILDPAEDGLSSAAVGNFLGNDEMEIAFSSRGGEAYAVESDPIELFFGWPKSASAPIEQGPILTKVTEFASDVVFADVGGTAYAETNVSGTVEGWPFPVGGSVFLSPLAGDIDNDDSLELIFYTESAIQVLDVDSDPTPQTPITDWPMYAGNNQRTGCAGCDLGPTTDAPVQTTDSSSHNVVTFRRTGPNPSHDGASFQLDLAQWSAVRLSIFDAKGRRVREVSRTGLHAGSHSLSWDGTGESGESVAAGAYFARLSARGEFGARRFVERMTLLR